MPQKGLRGVYYRQATKEIDGMLFNRGEDALPFVCDDFLLVADGLGGDGAFVHSHMTPAMWNSKKRRALFKINEDDEQLSSYFDDLFFEMDREAINGEKPSRYSKVPKYDLHSGYFGSRLAAYSFADLLRHDKRCKPQTLFENLDKAINEEIRHSCLYDYADNLCEKLIDKIQNMAKRGHFEKETTRMSAKLLPTKLAAALYRDIGEETQIICVWAGDSRIIAQLEDGCFQLTADDEKNEGMTNLISLSTEVHLNIREYRFKRPFALMAVTDGTFDDIGASLCFEACVPVDALNCKSQDEMNKTWDHIFNVCSKDDSASIAYYFFDMEDFEDCNRFVAPRTKIISEEYCSKLPGLLDKDYSLECQRLERPVKQRLKDLKDEILSDHQLNSYCPINNDVASPVYITNMEHIESEVHRIEKQENECLVDLRNYCELNWLKLRENSENPSINELAEKIRIVESAKEALKQVDIITEDIRKLAANVAEETDRDLLSGMIQKLKNTIFRWEERKNTCAQSAVFFEDRDSQALKEKEQLLEAESEKINEVVKQIWSEKEFVFDDDPDSIERFRCEYRKIQESKRVIDNKKRMETIEESKKQLESYLGNITDALMDQRILPCGKKLIECLSEEMRVKVESVLNSFLHEMQPVQEKAKIQKEIFDECDHNYLRFIQEDN